MNFTKQQSSAIRSIIFQTKTQIKIRFQNSPTVYTYTATPEVIQEIHNTAIKAKKDENTSIGQLISKLQKTQKIIQQPFNYKFQEIHKVNHQPNATVYAEDYIIKFKTKIYTFLKTNGNKMILAKYKTNHDKVSVLEFTKTLTKEQARKVWKNLHKRPTAITQKFSYYE
jgi:hypothetical protein